MGGRPIPSSCFQPVSEAKILNRIQPAVRDKIRCVDLRAVGISDFGRMRPRGFGNTLLPMPMALYCDDQPITLARWPDHGYARTGSTKVVNTFHGIPLRRPRSGFTFANERLKKWTTATDPWVYGFWCWDWADEYLPVRSINAQNHVIKFGKTHLFGIRAERRFYILNLIEELNQPGEWCLDKSRRMLYFYPPVPLRDARIVVSILSDPLVSLNSMFLYFPATADHWSVAATRESVFMGDKYNLVAGCTLRNLSRVAIQIGDPWKYASTARNSDGGRNNGVHSCDIYNVGGSGIILAGGDRKSLQAAGNFAINNHIHHFSQICRTYQPAIEISGVGNRVANNHIHHAAAHGSVVVRQ